MSDSQLKHKISIITPSYNQGRFLEKTIRSVLLQNYSNLEYIIIDGGSTDNSIEIIKKYQPWLSYWVSEPDRGQSNAINKGFEQATGNIYAWLNSDDIYLPNALNVVAQKFAEENNASLGALVGMGYKIDRSGKVVYEYPQNSKLNFQAFLDWRKSHFLQPSCFFTKEAWDCSKPLDESLNYCMDLDLWLKMAQKFSFKRLNQVLSYALAHQEAKTTVTKAHMFAEIAFVAMRYGAKDIAYRELMGLADSVVDANCKIQKLTTHPIYKLVGPIYRSCRSTAKFLHQVR